MFLKLSINERAIYDEKAFLKAKVEFVENKC